MNTVTSVHVLQEALLGLSVRLSQVSESEICISRNKVSAGHCKIVMRDFACDFRSAIENVAWDIKILY